jgi:RNA polymerase-binding transcription factor DksA
MAKKKTSIKKSVPAKKAGAGVSKTAKKVTKVPAAKKKASTYTAPKAKKTAAKKTVVKKTAVKKTAVKSATKPKAKVAVKKTTKTIVKPAAKKVVSKSTKKVSAVAPKAKPVAPKASSTKAIITKVSASNKAKVEELKKMPSYKRPEAMPSAQSKEDDRKFYNESELREFEEIIVEKLELAKRELSYIKMALSRKDDEGTDGTNSNMKVLEDGADTLEKESFSQLAARQQKFVAQLEAALLRIKNGTYGLCIVTGKLIPKDRLRAVPHTQHTIEGKLKR